jgi:hypothetical protein
MVRRPKCKLCGHEHYTHEPHAWDGAVAKRTDNPLADKPSIGRKRYVTVERPAERAAAMAQAIERINELEAEVRVLKRALAEAHGKLAAMPSVASTDSVVSTPCPVCEARRAVKAKAQRK